MLVSVAAAFQQHPGRGGEPVSGKAREQIEPSVSFVAAFLEEHGIDSSPLHRFLQSADLISAHEMQVTLSRGRALAEAVLRQEARRRAGTPNDVPILLPADWTILTVLANAKTSLLFFQICQNSADLVKDSRRHGVRESRLVTLNETVVKARIPILERADLVARPLDQNGKPINRKGVGITPKGLARLRHDTQETR
jgi:hypothetical protein